MPILVNMQWGTEVTAIGENFKSLILKCSLRGHCLPNILISLHFNLITRYAINEKYRYHGHFTIKFWADWKNTATTREIQLTEFNSRKTTYGIRLTEPTILGIFQNRVCIK